MLVYLIEKKYLTEHELSEPCYQTLDIRRILFPNGTLLKLDSNLVTLISKSSSSHSTSMSQQQTYSSNNRQTSSKPKQDWWDVDSGNAGNGNLSTVCPGNRSGGPPSRLSPLSHYERSRPYGSRGGSRYRSDRPGPYPSTYVQRYYSSGGVRFGYGDGDAGSSGRSIEDDDS